jgi:hypothetical protein
MANNTYVVRLIDCQKDSGGVKNDANEVLAKLKTWYASVCQKASSGDTQWTADVQWLDQPPRNLPGQDSGSPLTINMILFFVPTPRTSVIALHPYFKKTSLPLDDKDTLGFTALDTPTRGGVRQAVDLGISEIYTARCRDAFDKEQTRLTLARAAFHESMHNQLAKGDEMHQGGTGFRAAVMTGDSPNADNMKDMAAKIGTLTPQWLDGFQAWESKQNDPFAR